MFTLWPQFLVSNYIFSYFIPFGLTACIILHAKHKELELFSLLLFSVLLTT